MKDTWGSLLSLFPISFSLDKYPTRLQQKDWSGKRLVENKTDGSLSINVWGPHLLRCLPGALKLYFFLNI